MLSGGNLDHLFDSNGQLVIFSTIETERGTGFKAKARICTMSLK